MILKAILLVVLLTLLVLNWCSYADALPGIALAPAVMITGLAVVVTLFLLWCMNEVLNLA